MKGKYKLILVLLFVTLLSLGGIFYLRFKVYYAGGNNKAGQIFNISKGEGSEYIALNLEKNKIISGKWYFLYYLKKNNLLNKILPGEYSLSGKMTIPEIAVLITQKKEDIVKITFPEGWDSKKMAERISENGLNGKEFLVLVGKSENFKNKYDFLSDSKIKNLEGFLFPDTYFFKRDATPKMIIQKMLDNFDAKFSENLRAELKNKDVSIFDAIIMASILEKEVKSDEDRAIVSGIFWNRIKIGQALQSCATLAFVLGENKKQYSAVDIQTNSPYNTYQNKGLPPGPISNPGLSTIKAAIYPVDSNYNYFLSDPETGNTVFSKTFEEHNANKLKYGL